MPVKTLVATPDREPSRASTIAHAVTTNAASGGSATVTVPIDKPVSGVLERVAVSVITKQLITDETDPAKLREYATRLLKRAESAESDARYWEDEAGAASREADAVMFRQSQIDRAGDLAHAGHDRFPWRMCDQEVCKLLQEATGRGTDTR